MENKLTEDEARTLYEKHRKELLVRFYSYYKYTFSWKGENEEIEFDCSFGGDSDSIYRFGVTTEPINIPKFDELKNEFKSFGIKDKKTGHGYSFYDLW